MTGLLDADGDRVVRYSYDPAGDLTKAERLGNEVARTYAATSSEYERAGGTSTHRFRSLTTPAGRRPAISEYGPDGRLVAMIDAFGRRIELSHDLAGRREIVTDRRGNQSVLVFRLCSL